MNGLWEHEDVTTTFDWEGEKVWRFYNHRGNAGKPIKEAETGFTIDQFSSGSEEGNLTLQRLKLLTYNLFGLSRYGLIRRRGKYTF
ncbi:hypothetical protein [Kyrpidia tusciae]|uniref:Uncharacterized protein n=1 Tax=Kyrpidia tusciae (strain DSM 2912 / NBRC 15312 / T2) TaxID=562970 RepID=D5WT61_KYRT2|nr:hypothetical protein [Kyrpidia tusciae]ADG05165.1 hypothetical protein Btus_0397 [Kyrpidia tusciae DSM 2912]